MSKQEIPNFLHVVKLPKVTGQLSPERSAILKMAQEMNVCRKKLKKLRDGLDEGLQQVYDHMGEFFQKQIASYVSNPPKPDFRECAFLVASMLTAFGHCILAYKKVKQGIRDLVNAMPHMGTKGRPIRICSVACGAAWLLPLYLYLQKKLDLHFEYVGVDQDELSIKQASSLGVMVKRAGLPVRLKCMDVNDDKQFSKIKINGGFDWVTLLHPGVVQDPRLPQDLKKSPFVNVLNVFIPKIAAPLARFYMTTYLEEEMKSYLAVLAKVADKRFYLDSAAMVNKYAMDYKNRFLLNHVQDLHGERWQCPMSCEIVLWLSGCAGNKKLLSKSLEVRVQKHVVNLYRQERFQQVVSLLSYYLNKRGFADKDSDKATLLFSQARAFMMLSDFQSAQQPLSQVCAISKGMPNDYYGLTRQENDLLLARKKGSPSGRDLLEQLTSVRSGLEGLGKAGNRLSQLNAAIQSCQPSLVAVSITREGSREGKAINQAQCRKA